VRKKEIHRRDRQSQGNYFSGIARRLRFGKRGRMTERKTRDILPTSSTRNKKGGMKKNGGRHPAEGNGIVHFPPRFRAFSDGREGQEEKNNEVEKGET